MADQYDQEHHETGSSNISAATDEWQAKLAEARLINDGSEPVLHTAYRLVNEDVAQGARWYKCANCGSPYRLSPEWQGTTVCSSECHNEFIADIVGSLGSF